MTQSKGRTRTAESRDRAGGRRPGSVLTASPTSPRENPPADETRIRMAREDYARVVGN